MYKTVTGELAKQRARKLKELGISREEVFNHLMAVVDDIREDAVKRAKSK